MVEKPRGKMSESGKEGDSERDMDAAISTLSSLITEIIDNNEVEWRTWGKKPGESSNKR